MSRNRAVVMDVLYVVERDTAAFEAARTGVDIVCAGDSLTGWNNFGPAWQWPYRTYPDFLDPPVLTLHGDKDALVPVEQAKTLDEKMKAAGANHTLMVFEGQGHGFGGESGKKAADATWDFLDQHLKP